jgi:serine protease Do
MIAGAALAIFAVGSLQGQSTVPPPAPPPADPPRIALPAATPALPLRPEIYTFRDVVKKVVPAVVSIEASAAKPAVRVGQALPPGIPEEFRRFFEMANPEGGDRADPNLGFGSGVIIEASGVILTNFHVVDGADSVEVKLQDGRTFTSKDIRKDPKTDLAVIKLAVDQPLPALELGDSEAMEVGDRVLAIGAPFGLTGSVTHGIISAKSRSNLRLNQYEDFLQTDAAINPGNSGGPLVSLEGKVIGINSAIKTKSGGFQGVGLAISSNMARDVATQLLKTGVVRRGYLGITIRELDDELAARLGVKKGTGVVVTKVLESGPAAKAGLQAGDVITSVGGVIINDVNALPKAVIRMPLNEKVEVQFVRDGKPQSLQVNVENQPEDYGPRASSGVLRGVTIADLGLTVTDLTPETAVQLGLPRDARGAVVIGVERGSLAASAGLVRGAVIVRVDKTLVGNAKQFVDAIANVNKDRGALLYLLRSNGDVEFLVLKFR